MTATVNGSGVRTYRGQSLEEIVPRIRAELGPDAVIVRQRDGLTGGVAGFFQKRLPERGFRLGRGDAEAHEKESPFSGHGYRGSWRVVKNPTGCPVVAVFVVLIRQAQQP